MTTTGLSQHEERFRAAVSAENFLAAQQILRDYIDCFQARPRSLIEVEEARNLLLWGVQTAKAHKAQLAEELMLLGQIFDAYQPRGRMHTWRVDA